MKKNTLFIVTTLSIVSLIHHDITAGKNSKQQPLWGPSKPTINQEPDQQELNQITHPLIQTTATATPATCIPTGQDASMIIVPSTPPSNSIAPVKEGKKEEKENNTDDDSDLKKLESIIDTQEGWGWFKSNYITKTLSILSYDTIPANSKKQIANHIHWACNSTIKDVVANSQPFRTKTKNIATLWNVLQGNLSKLALLEEIMDGAEEHEIVLDEATLEKYYTLQKFQNIKNLYVLSLLQSEASEYLIKNQEIRKKIKNQKLKKEELNYDSENDNYADQEVILKKTAPFRKKQQTK